jgi:hypothetical protein
MTIPTDKDERTGQFHAEAQKLVWGWMESSKVKKPIADTMDPLSCLTYAIVQKMEETYQEAKAEDPKAESKLSKLRGKFKW